jgi:RNA polymerase sigma-70 factor (ECF subfamily)
MISTNNCGNHSQIAPFRRVVDAKSQQRRRSGAVVPGTGTVGLGRQAPDGDLRAWLFSILYRQFLDAHRRSRRYARMLEFFTGRDDAQPSTERTVIAQSTLQAFDRLPTEQRALLLWVSVEGLSYKEVAEILDVPTGTVMSRLSRARQALRQLSDGEINSPSLRILK